MNGTTQRTKTLLRYRTADENRDVIEEAIQRQQRVELLYERSGERVVRLLSPYEVRDQRRGDRGRAIGADVVGWDHERRDYRTFKLGSILGTALIQLPAHEAQVRPESIA